MVDPVTEPIPYAWDAFVKEESLPVLWHGRTLATASWLGQTPSVLCAVTDGTRTVALFFGRLQGLSDPRRYHAPAKAAPGFFECRLYPGSLAGYRFDPRLDAAGQAAAVAAFESALRGRFGRRVAGVAYRHVAPEHVAAVRGRTSLVRPVQPEPVLYNRWSEPGQYRAELPGKWRSQLRKVQATVAADPTLSVRLCPEVPERDATRLVQQIGRRHRPWWLIRPPIPESYFRVLNEDPGTEFVCYFSGERLLAFSTVHDTGTELQMSHWGSRDRTDGGRQNIYFDQFLRVADLMIERGRAVTRFGKGMTEIKARFATTQEPRFLVAGR